MKTKTNIIISSNRIYHTVQKTAKFFAGAIAIVIIASIQTATAQTIPISNGNFTQTSDDGSIGGSLLGGSTIQQLGSGPWSGDTNGTLGLILPPTVSISDSAGGGFGEINNTLSVLEYASIFQTLSGQNYTANTTYALTVTITNSSLVGLSADALTSLLATDGVGFGLTAGGSTTSEGTYVADSVSGSPILTLLSGSSATLTLDYTTSSTAPTGNIGVRLFANPTAGVLSDVKFSDVNLTVVPEPSTIVLVCIFGFGMLLLFRRRYTAIE